MTTLKRDLDLTYLYITHDLATAKFFCDRIAIMYLGRIVEIGPAQAIYDDPKHPYTQALLRAIPEPDPTREAPRDLPRGEVPDAAQPPLGCSFHPRCAKAFDVCGWESRDLRDLLETRWATGGRERFEAESAVFGDLEPLATPATSRILQPPKGGSAAAVLGLLEQVRDEDPAEPLWSGVDELRDFGDHVSVRFHEPREPRLQRVDEVDVACHLYDADADLHKPA